MFEPYNYPAINPFISELKHSTTNCSGQFTQIGPEHIKPSELWQHPLPPYIVQVQTGAGKVINPQYDVTPPAKPSNRGRKPKPKAPSTRAPGGIFGSQIQITVLSNRPGKHYKIKCFNSGTFQIPGVLHPLMYDIFEPLYYLSYYFTIIFKFPEPVRIFDVHSIMTNVRCKFILGPSERISLQNCFNAITNYRAEQPDLIDINKEIDRLPMSAIAKSHLNMYMRNNRLKIISVVFNPETSRGVDIRFARPKINDQKPSKITIEILQSGNISFSGGKVLNEIEEVYEWLAWFIINYKQFIIRDFSRVNNEQAEQSTNNTDLSSYINNDIQSKFVNLFRDSESDIHDDDCKLGDDNDW